MNPDDNSSSSYQKLRHQRQNRSSADREIPRASKQRRSPDTQSKETQSHVGVAPTRGRSPGGDSQHSRLSSSSNNNRRVQYAAQKNEDDFVLPSDRLHEPVASSDAFGSIIRDYLEQQDRLFANKYEHIVDYNRRRRLGGGEGGKNERRESRERVDGGRIYSSIRDPNEADQDVSVSMSSSVCTGEYHHLNNMNKKKKKTNQRKR